MQDAKANHTQIIVFPEYGLTGDGTTDGKDWTRAGAHTGLTSRQASHFRICHTAAAESLVEYSCSWHRVTVKCSALMNPGPPDASCTAPARVMREVTFS